MSLLKLAPIVLFVYNRPQHTELTLNALYHNKLASESTLYIYSDGLKENASHETIIQVSEVRSVIRKQKWCKKVVIIESDKNKGLAESIKNGVSEVIKQHGKVIVMEDDLITSTAFLTYMNKALDYYQKRMSVFSISGYNLPPNKMPIPDDYDYDVYASLRNGSWGWATWEDRWNQVDWSVSNFKVISKNQPLQDAFNRRGDDVYPMLESQQSGKLNIWSIQFTVAHFENHAVSIVPTVSYVDNIGLDGTGENCKPNLSLRNRGLNENENIKFLDILYEDKRIINAFYSANCSLKRPLWQKIINRLSRSLGGENVFVIKRKVFS